MGRRHGEGCEHTVGQVDAEAGQRVHELAVRPTVGPQTCGRPFDRAVQEGRAIAVERMGQGNLGMDPFEAVVGQRQVSKGR